MNYCDPLLQNLYFIDPLWLCKMTGKVVDPTRVHQGVMDLSNLKQLLHGAEFPSCELNEYVALLEKFEVALKLEGDRLLIPSVLPEKQEEAVCVSSVSLGFSETLPAYLPSPQGVETDKTIFGASTPSATRGIHDQPPRRVNTFHRMATLHRVYADVPMEEPPTGRRTSSSSSSSPSLSRSLYRIYLLPYQPSGFWPRLVSRILADKSIRPTCLKLLSKSGIKPKMDAIQWYCWQRGLYMSLCEKTVLAFRSYSTADLPCRWQEDFGSASKSGRAERGVMSGLSTVIQLDGQETAMGALSSACIEIAVAPGALFELLNTCHRTGSVPYAPVRQSTRYPRVSRLTHAESRDSREDTNVAAPRHSRWRFTGQVQGTTDARPAFTRMRSIGHVTPKESVTGKRLLFQLAAFLLSKAAYHIDSLLQDWYEGLQPGYRASQEDESVVKRIIPCPSCIEHVDVRDASSADDREVAKRKRPALKRQQSLEESCDRELYLRHASVDDWQFVDITDISTCDTVPAIQSLQCEYVSLSACLAHVYMNQKSPKCSKHGDVPVATCAPDAVSVVIISLRHC